MLELNKAMLVGNLTRDPEARSIPSGARVVSFGLACNRYLGKDREPETLFIDIEAWDKTAEFIEKWFKKGSAIYVEGRLKMDRWEDKEMGGTRTKLKVVAEQAKFAGSGGGAKEEGGGGEERKPASSGPRAAGGSKRAPSASASARSSDDGGAGYAEVTDDDLPF